MGKRTSSLHVAAAGWEATEKGGYRQSHTVADVSLVGLVTKGVANKSGLMEDTVAVPKSSARDSRNVHELADYARTGTDFDRLDVALNPISDEATINYIARCTTSDATELAVLQSLKLDADAVAHYAKSNNVAVRAAAKRHPKFKPSVSEWPAHALNRMVRGNKIAA